MKSIRSIIVGGLVLVVSLVFVGAQSESFTNFSAEDTATMLEELELATPVAASSLPQFGTFWSAQHAPGLPGAWPPLPGNTLGLDAWPIGDGNYVLNDTNVNYDAVAAEAAAVSGRFHADDGGPGLPGGGSGGGTNDTYGSDFTMPDYGTNLWIAQVGISSNNLMGIASNTVADVQYEIQSLTDLTQTNWVSQGFFLGSETTNWTPLNALAVTTTNNAFLRLRSWASSDGSGLPDWWELQNFGTIGIDPNAQDSAGDGWTIYQKFQMGLNPNVFYPPAAPQGVSVSFNSNNGQVVLNWAPSSGSVTNYLISKIDYQTGLTTSFNVSPMTVDFIDDLSGDSPDLDFTGPGLQVDYSVEAQYARGSSPTTTASLGSQPSISVEAMRGTQGNLDLIVLGLPADITGIKIYRAQVDAYIFGGDDDLGGEIYQTAGEYYWSSTYVSDPLTNGYFEISADGITNGVFPIPTNQVSPFGSYHFWVQGERANGANTEWSQDNIAEWSVYNGPLLDARQQLKDNLRFILRAASQTKPFQFVVPVERYNYYAWPTNYVFASLYNSGIVADNGDPGNFLSFDEVRPLVENYELRNFAFDGTDYLGSDGFLSTGVYYGGVDGSSFDLYITTAPTVEFDIGGLLGTPTSPIPESLLTPAQSRWIVPIDGTSDYPTSGGAQNLYGLSYLSVNDVTANNGQLYSTVYSPVETITNGFPYFETAQPNFAGNDYYFAESDYGSGPGPLPEQSVFTTTNVSPLVILGVGQMRGENIPYQIAGYAKLAVTNGYSGVYAYLGQYFDQSYKVDTNGLVTSNTTGILSPYGELLATEPGPIALVTMPDIDTGQRGTDIVYCVFLQVDKNHDGTMDPSFTGPDATSFSSPMVLWANNNYDRWTPDSADETNYMDDVRIADCPYTPNVPTPDCNYRDQDGNRVIPCTRDLEDYFRLWVSGVTPALLMNLPPGCTITLNWGDVGSPNPANPTIDIFQASDPNGGIGYLTNETAALNQIDPTQSAYVGRVAPGQGVQLNASYFSGWAGNHFIMCGVSNGTGGLNLTIADVNGNMLAQSTTYIQIQDIKQMYERWTVGDQLSRAPLTNAIPASEGLPANVPSFEYASPPDTNTPYILYVHGWNMESWEKDRFAETAFKRLYWQGYQGRFGLFRWPTGNQFTGDFSQLLSDPTEKDNYDGSENNASLSGVGLLNKLNDLNGEYPGHVYVLAHSMGNVVTGEALRLAGSNQVINTYVASQAAVSAHTYDATVPDYSFERTVQVPVLGNVNFNFGPNTPDIYGNWFAGNDGGGAGQIISFYNTNDYALSANHWQFDQLLKPDALVSESGSLWDYRYNGGADDPAPWNNFFKTNDFTGVRVNLDIVNTVTNRYEVMAYAAQSYSAALGATPEVLNINRNVDLTRSSPTRIWPIDLSENPYGAHFWHSAEFRNDYASMQGYWSELLGVEAFNLK